MTYDGDNQAYRFILPPHFPIFDLEVSLFPIALPSWDFSKSLCLEYEWQLITGYYLWHKEELLEKQKQNPHSPSERLDDSHTQATTEFTFDSFNIINSNRRSN